MGSLAEWIAATAAVLAAIVVAYQSWQTKRSADSANSASVAANAALEMARSSLALARAEEGNTRTIIEETIKARIDNHAQWLNVDAPVSASWPPYEPSIAGGEANRIGLDRTYRLPRDRDSRIIVRQLFTVLNEHPRGIMLGMNAWDVIGEEVTTSLGPGRYWIAANSRMDGSFDIERTLSEWVAIAEARANGGAGDQYTYTVTAYDNRDAGAIDSYDIIVGGSPVVPIENEVGGWRLHPAQFRDFARKDPVLGAVALPGTRRYYLSKRNDKPLD
ncbi:hypothetical protein OG394_16925 [Kribbella sp. NBC_01245]|uniref:hypothetical protein n=1 Tax=Kribbella sp. NBC_01245 TaxID=2903578 RepID=UPI002E27B477|nr:hypothetical protein [Kribbella sp. NBC_01245]